VTGIQDPAPPVGAGDGAWRASGFVVAALCSVFAARIAAALSGGGRDQVPFIVALFVLPLLYALPPARGLLDRYRWPALAVQVVLTWLPFVLFGGAWSTGVGGLLAALVLLMVPGRRSRLLAGGLAVLEAVLRSTVIGLPVTPRWYGVADVLLVYADDALLYFGLVRLTQIVGDVQRARAQAARLAVARERLQAAEALHAAVGERLAEVAAQAATAQRAVPSEPEQARAEVAAAGVVAREAIARARTVTAGWRAPALPEPAAPVQPAAGAVIAPRLAWAVLVAVLSGFAADSIASVVVLPYPAWRTAAAIADIVVVTVLLLYLSRPASWAGRPRGWPSLLAVQASLVYVSMLPPVHAYLGALGPFLAGSVLLLVSGWPRWVGYAAVVASWSLLYELTGVGGAGFGQPVGRTVLEEIYLGSATAGFGLMVFGLSWLARLAVQLEALRGELALIAVMRERLRIARDVHDLLGLGLSAIALKADLIARLIGGDDVRAAAEIAELTRICAAARADIRLVTGESRPLKLATELDAARQILASAGIDTRVSLADRVLPAAADTVLAPVLREAVTNILRHSTATTCAIEAIESDGVVRLRVRNDGLADRPADPDARDTDARAGSGLANLTVRVRAAGGQLTSQRVDGWFVLVAEIPLRAVTR
jgi:two-component system, NarL family, sensor histidine kinase DesK